jgi:thermitase
MLIKKFTLQFSYRLTFFYGEQMKKMSVLGFLGLLVSAQSALAKMSSDYAPFVPGEVLVKVRPGMKGKFLSKAPKLSVKVKEELNLSSGNFLLLKSHAASTRSMVSLFDSYPEVEYAEPNYLYKAIGTTPSVESLMTGTIEENKTSSTPSDPLFDKLWGLNNTGSNEPQRLMGQDNSGVSGADVEALKAWRVHQGSRKVVVAVIDTGIDYNHPDLRNNMWVNNKEVPGNGVDDDSNGYVDDVFGWNAESNHGNPMDGNSHGTHCAGTIGAEHNNGVGVAGVMKDVQLMAVKFLSDSGSGSLADAIEAIDYATKMNVDVMSNSWGGGGFSQALEDSIKRAKEKGIVFVAAAGNDSSNNDSRPTYPSTYQVDNVISVASHTAQDNLSYFSNLGKRTVHVAAPGSNVLSSTPNGQYKVYSGTSMATPHVAGLVGLLIAKEGRSPVLDLRNRLMATTNPVSTYRKTTASGGRVSAFNLLTNTRPPRQEPNENAWRVEPLREVFETDHPYFDNTKLTQTYYFPGAKYVRLVIEKYETETGYDFITLKDAKGSVIEKVSGNGLNYETDYTESDTITVEFSSDTSLTRWGVVIREAKVIY